ncbi:hypothetical protein ACFLSH_01165 [Bacteroidota bacterium]
MKKSLVIIIILFTSFNLFPADHGIYLLTNKDIKTDFKQVSDDVVKAIENAGFRLLGTRDMATPDGVRENGEDICGFKGKLVMFSSDEYIQMLTSFGNKYLVASFLKIGIYETVNGIMINIADPETINRIVFNDLDDENYEKAVSLTLPYKQKIVSALHSLDYGNNVEEAMEPKRETDELRDADRDMFMMVGPMTLFDDEDQFPIIYKEEDVVDPARLESLKESMFNNISEFQPNEDDSEYRWTTDPDIDLKWHIVGEVSSPDHKALMFGLTRNRTESESFRIVGDETETNKCPGINHLTAFPVEVLLMKNEDNELVVQTARQMIRMDMYFWDAGMAAFMDHMGMPGMLDESIYRALFAKDKE